MKRKCIIQGIFFLITFSASAFSASALPIKETPFTEQLVTLKTTTGLIQGTLTIPDNSQNIPVALIIAGSGPTDRDGNNPYIKNDCLKKLAHSLAALNIASLRYDKRGVAQSKLAVSKEDSLNFDNYIEDAKDWIALLKKKQFTQIVIIGHSEGSLIGMLAADHANKFISLEGAGQSADKILKEQLNSQPQQIKDLTFLMIDSLKNGHKVTNVSPFLSSLFRPSVQPYLISWFKYSPEEELKKLKIPTLIIQGTKDLEVTTENAKQLAKANLKAKLVFIEGMNHILRKVNGEREENISTYNNISLPIDKQLIIEVSHFILEK